MTQDLQQLLEKINTDGVEKAKTEATKIISKAEAQAKETIETAQREPLCSLPKPSKRPPPTNVEPRRVSAKPHVTPCSTLKNRSQPC